MFDESPGPPRRGRPAVLSRRRLVTVAARMDPATLTMSAVAAELGVGPSALYRWVSDREGLLDLVSDSMAQRILPAGEPTADTWREWLTEWAHNVRREFAEVPGFALRVLTGPHRSVGHDPLHERGVRAFTLAGLDLDDAFQCWYAFSVAVAGWVVAEGNSELPRPVEMRFEALLRILLAGAESCVDQR